MATAFTSLLFYLKILAFPHPLLFYYGLYTIPEWPLWSFPVIFSAMIHLGFLFVIIYGIRKKTATAFGLAFYILTVFMFSNIPENVNGIVAERLIFVPSFGIAIVLAALFTRVFRVPSGAGIKEIPLTAKIVLLLLFVFYTGKTIVRNTSWYDSRTLFTNDIRYNYRSVQANTILAGEMMDRVMKELNKGAAPQRFKNTTDSVIAIYNRAWMLYLDNYRVLNNLGDMYMTFRGQPDTALAYLACAFRLEPGNFYVNFNIARGFEMKGDHRMALFYYFRANQLDPGKPQPLEKIKELQGKSAGTVQ